MAEQICPTCKAGNPPDNRYCGRCGTRLQASELELVGKANMPSVSGKPDPLPDVDVQALGRAVAVSVGALVAEMALRRTRQKVLGDSPAGKVTSNDTNDATQSLIKAGVGALAGLALLAAERQLSRLNSGQSVRRLRLRGPKGGSGS